SDCPALDLGDFDGDGDVDLVAADYGNGLLRIWLNRGDGSFEPGTDIHLGKTADSVHVGDFNGDHVLDLAAFSPISTPTSPSGFFILLGRGDGTFVAGPDHVGGVYGWAVADVDGDGDSDLVEIGPLFDLSTGKIVTTAGVALCNGDGTFRFILP